MLPLFLLVMPKAVLSSKLPRMIEFGLKSLPSVRWMVTVRLARPVSPTSTPGGTGVLVLPWK